MFKLAATQLLVNRLRTIVKEQTGVGELQPLGHPEYGSRHESQIGQPNVDRTRNLVKLYVLEALQQEPRIQQIVSCTVAPSPDQPSQVLIAARLVLLDQDSPVNFVIPFNLAVLQGRPLTLMGSGARSRRSFAAMMHMARYGGLHGVVGKTFDLAETAKAHEVMAGRDFFGKLVLRVP